jgi:glyoxylase-like metal-dependent hydrolase (beta-lactamase superfamily II)
VIPDSRVVFAGDLLFHDMLPTLVDASMLPWIATLDALLAQHAGYTFVPGHGDVGHSQDVTAFRDYLQTLHTFVTNAKARGKSGEAVLESVMPALKEKYGHMEFFEGIARQNVLETDAELNGTKRLPPTLQ